MSAAPKQCHYFSFWIKRLSHIKTQSVIICQLQENPTGISACNCSIRLHVDNGGRRLNGRGYRKNTTSGLKAVFEMTAALTQVERRRSHWRTAAAITPWSRLAHSVLMRCLRSARSVLRIFFSYLKCHDDFTENWLNFVKVMPKILSVILTNLHFRTPVVQQRN